MAYTPSIPVESNFVRGASGDLVLMAANFDALAPLVSGYTVSGTVPSAKLLGFAFGDSHFRLLVSGSDLRLDRFSGGSWLPLFTFANGAADIQAARTISGQDPTQSYHLVTRAFVDALALDDISDVNAPSPATGEGLVWDGAEWVNSPVASALSGLSDVALLSPASGEALIFNGTQWENGAVATMLSGLADVILTSPVAGQALLYSGGGVWYNQTIVSDHGGLTGLGDDDHTQYSLADGTRPFTGPVSGVTPTQDDHLATKAYVDTLSGLTISGAFNLPELLDVADDTTSSAVSGEVLTFDGTEWHNQAPQGGTGGADILQVQIFS